MMVEESFLVSPDGWVLLASISSRFRGDGGAFGLGGRSGLVLSLRLSFGKAGFLPPTIWARVRPFPSLPESAFFTSEHLEPT